MTNSPKWDSAIALLAAVIAGAYFFFARTSVDVQELLKDTFEPFDLATLPLARETQVQLFFSLIGAIIGLTTGLIVHDFVKQKTVAGMLWVTFGNRRLWLVLTAATLISLSVFYHAFVDF